MLAAVGLFECTPSAEYRVRVSVSTGAPSTDAARAGAPAQWCATSWAATANTRSTSPGRRRGRGGRTPPVGDGARVGEQRVPVAGDLHEPESGGAGRGRTARPRWSSEARTLRAMRSTFWACRGWWKIWIWTASRPREGPSTAPLVHRVVGGEDGVVLQDRHVGGVVEIAPAVPHPRPPQRAGGHRRLSQRGAHDGLEPGRLPTQPCPGAPRGRRGGGTSGRGASPSTRRSPAPRSSRVHWYPMAGSHSVPEIGAVRGHGRGGPAAREAARVEADLEREPQRVAEQQGRLQSVDPVAELLVLERPRHRRQVEAQGPGLGTQRGRHVERVDCRSGPVHEVVGPTDLPDPRSG